MTQITVYEKRTCSACRSLSALLTDCGIDFEGSTTSSSRRGRRSCSVFAKAELRPRDVLRIKEPAYRELGWQTSHFTTTCS